MKLLFPKQSYYEYTSIDKNLGIKISINMGRFIIKNILISHLLNENSRKIKNNKISDHFKINFLNYSQ